MIFLRWKPFFVKKQVLLAGRIRPSWAVWWSPQVLKVLSLRTSDDYIEEDCFLSLFFLRGKKLTRKTTEIELTFVTVLGGSIICRKLSSVRLYEARLLRGGMLHLLYENKSFKRLHFRNNLNKLNVKFLQDFYTFLFYITLSAVAFKLAD